MATKTNIFGLLLQLRRRASSVWMNSGLLAVLVVVGTGLVARVTAQPPVPGRLQTQDDSAPDFMREKLKLSQELLEGLVRADFDRIDQSAQKLNSLSQHTHWTEREQDPVYRHFTVEFQRLTQRISQQARTRNLDAATYGAQGLTANCIACHQHVRDVQALRPDSP